MLQRYLEEVEVAFSGVKWDYQFVMSQDVVKSDHKLLYIVIPSFANK